jgi:predicted nucleotidyltransferase
VQAIIKKIKSVLTSYPNLAVAILYGSWASGQQRPHSDVDLAVALIAPFSWAEQLRLRERLEAELGRAVDLINLQEAHGVLLNEVLDNGIMIIKNDDALYARILSRRIGENADFMPLYQYILAERRKRFLQPEIKNDETSGH